MKKGAGGTLTHEESVLDIKNFYRLKAQKINIISELIFKYK